METQEGGLKEIKNKKLILVEGKDDVDFFVKLIDKLKISGCLVWGIGGKDNFNIELPTMSKLPGFNKLTHFGIIRDKDDDNAFESIKNILKQKMGITHAPSAHGEIAGDQLKVGVFISPGKSVEGKCLEDLCLKITEQHPAMKCVNSFAKCVSDLESPPKNISKSKALSFLATQIEPVNTIGLAAQKGYWDFDSPVLNELKEFLTKFK